MRIGKYIACMAKSRSDGHFVVDKLPAGLTWQVASNLVHVKEIPSFKTAFH